MTTFSAYLRTTLTKSDKIEREGYTNLNWGPSTVLMVVGLRLRRNGGSTVVGDAARGVGDNGGVGRVDVVLFVVGRSRDPLKLLHIDQPDVAASLTGSGGGHNECDNIRENCEGSKSVRPTQPRQMLCLRIIQLKKPNAAIAWVAPQTTAYYQIPVPGERGRKHTGELATNDTTDGGSGLSTSSEPHDAQVRQPPDLEGNPGCKDAIADAPNEDPKQCTISFR